MKTILLFSALALVGCSVRALALVETEGATTGKWSIGKEQTQPPTSAFPAVATPSVTPTTEPVIGEVDVITPPTTTTTTLILPKW